MEDQTIGYANCPLLMRDYVERTQDPEFWKPFDDIYQKLIYEKFSKIFNISQVNMKFIPAYFLGDLLYSEKVEGLLERDTFNIEEWEIIRNIQAKFLKNALSPESSKLFGSRNLNPVIEMIKKVTNKKHNESMVEDFNDAKFLAFASHDFQISHILALLNPMNINITYIDFASQVFIEVHKKESKFGVKLFFNDQPLHLPG